MIVRIDGRRQRLDEMPDNASVVALGAHHSESWRIADRPMVASPCRCESPAYFRDVQLGAVCVFCGRRPAA
jgi:hypothetical protein